MVVAEQKDEEIRKSFPPAGKEAHRAHVVRKAFWSSLGLVVATVLAGVVVGWVPELLVGRPTGQVITVLQIIGAALLLWGTLFVRGWDIQTIGGVTLTERVNQWIYRFLYLVGTGILNILIQPMYNCLLVILRPEDEEQWLDASRTRFAKARSVLRP